MFKRLPTALVLAALGLTISLANAQQTISGPARAVDGRTLSVDRTYVQLEGVDAAETGTTWGDSAWFFLTNFVADFKDGVTCKLTGNVDATSGRALGRCYVNGDRDVAESLIAGGAALACPAQVGDRYDTAEKYSRELSDKRGSDSKQPRSSRCARGK